MKYENEPKLIEYLIHRVEKIDDKVDQLLQFKWQIVGGSILLSIGATAFIQILSIYITKT